MAMTVIMFEGVCPRTSQFSNSHTYSSSSQDSMCS